MSFTRIAVPANATIIKGSLRNLLDGNSAASLQHTASMVEKIHDQILDNNDTHYSVDEFTKLLDATRALVIYNRDYNIFRNQRGSDVDFIIVGYSGDHDSYIARLYNVQEKEQITALKISVQSDSIEELLSGIWGKLSSSYRRADDEVCATTGVLCFERASGNMLIPNDYLAYGNESNVANAGFTLKPLDNVTKQAVNSQTSSANAQTIENKGNNIMSKVSSIVAANKSAVVNAAKLEAGKIALTQITKVAAKKAPFMIKGYIDTPIGRVVIANLLSVAVDQYAPTNAKAKAVAGAAMEAAMLEMVQSFNIAEMIDEMVKGIDISTFTQSAETE
ncbi:DNA N-6-adenine methyltransferase [Salmonella phage STG2]|uniref:DNA N-6-adenine methyltransferase n=1 Tax=Salmonella phage STG2 TaxID=2480623 RepID=A0A3G2KAV9_9CAUD|nr:DNA N-6-adenine methyltransferase [Salmonella phage STG2]AYN56110.1 DNA N-6-adenine methyltransferase [Salmonella phage STG2]